MLAAKYNKGPKVKLNPKRKAPIQVANSERGFMILRWGCWIGI